MGKMLDYTFYKCRDCEVDFLLSRKGFNYKLPFCPKCGENVYIEKVMDGMMERPFQYKRRWTAEEDELIKTGVQAGYTHRRVSESLDGRTKDAVRSRWMRIREDREELK